MKNPLQRNLIEISFLAFLSGFFSLCIQVIATHYAFLAHPQSSYAIGMSLFAFLTGLGVASSIAVRYQKKLLANFQRVIAWVFTGVGIYFLTITMVSQELRQWVHMISTLLVRDPGWQHLLSITLMSFWYLFIPATALGLLFPVLNDRRSGIQTSLTGKTSLFDYLGAGLGSLFCAFVLVPNIGLKDSSILVGMLILAASLPWHLNWARVAVTGLALVLPVTLHKSEIGTLWNVHESFTPREIVFSEPSPYGDILVTRDKVFPYHLVLSIGQRRMCSNTFNSSEQLLATLPVSLLKRGSLRTMNIGLGCGYTASALKKQPTVKTLDIVEINPVIVDANQVFGNELLKNFGAATQIHVEEGYQYLLGHPDLYDLIVVDVEEPTVLHSSALFTKEFFQAVKAHLQPDGIFSLWAFDQPETGRIVLNTLRSVFPFADVIVEDGALVFIAGNVTQNLAHDPVHFRDRHRLLNSPQKEIATLTNNPYPKYFKIATVFGLPPWYEDPFEKKN
jgi:spermidine synthase